MIPAAGDAERFSDYLVAQKIENMVEESASGNFAVWVEHDDDIDRAKIELDAFLKASSDSKYDACEQADKLRLEREKKDKQRRTKYVDVRTHWGGAQQWACPVTIVLIALSIVVSMGTRLGHQMDPWGDYLRFATEDALQSRVEEIARDHDLTRKSPEEMSRLIMNVGYDQILHGQVWRLVTPIFLHFGILHLLFNMFWLRDFGAMIETRRGSGVMIGLVLLIAILSNIGECWWSGPFFGGMSGITYGLFGYIWVKQRQEPHLGLGVHPQTALILMIWLGLCLTGMISSVANAAHVIGLIIGAVFAYTPVAWRRARRRMREIRNSNDE